MAQSALPRHWSFTRAFFDIYKFRSTAAVGVTLLNISLDTLQPERFEQMTRRRGLERVLGTIYAAVDQGFDPVKVPLALTHSERLGYVLRAGHVSGASGPSRLISCNK